MMTLPLYPRIDFFNEFYDNVDNETGRRANWSFTESDMIFSHVYRKACAWSY
jgi:hypothetical protein